MQFTSLHIVSLLAQTPIVEVWVGAECLGEGGAADVHDAHEVWYHYRAPYWVYTILAGATRTKQNT
jgi:hypothetical protein